MDIMTISSLAGLGIVPGTILTYGDALLYLDTLASRIQTAITSADAANAARRVSPSGYNSITSQHAAISLELDQLRSRLGTQGHGIAMSAADAGVLSTLDAEVTAFEASVAAVQKSGTWIFVGLAAVAATGLVIWATSKLPSYARKRRRRR